MMNRLSAIVRAVLDTSKRRIGPAPEVSGTAGDMKLALRGVLNCEAHVFARISQTCGTPAEGRMRPAGSSGRRMVGL